MIIKLKGADFSANNIGKVQVTTELHPYTLAAIEASGNTSLTLEQKSALNALFLAMGVDGSNDVMSKMHKVYLPIIAQDVSKALVNYNSDSFVVDKVLTSEYWTLRSHGLVGVKQGQSITLTEENPIMANNFSEFILRTEKMISGVDDSTYGIVLRGKTSTNSFLGIRYQSVSSNALISLAEYGADWSRDGATGKIYDMIKCSAINSSPNFATSIQLGTLSQNTSPYTINTDMTGETSQTLYVFGLGNENLAKPYAVGMIGEALTREQTLDIASKIDALYDTFA